MKMRIKIDYIQQAELVLIENQSVDKKTWNTIYSYLCDYYPKGIVLFSSYNISFPWRYFLSIKEYLGTIFRMNNLVVQFTDIARTSLILANNNAYDSAINEKIKSAEEINRILEERCFRRKLTNNQMKNLSKISSLPGAATFSVPGAGKTTEALAFFFINAEEKDRLLVVAPKNAFGAWDEQIKDCLLDDSNYFVRLRGGEANIQLLLESKPKFMIITYQQFPRVKTLMAETLVSENIFMFLDESHRIKGGKQGISADAILDLSHLPAKKLIMSGTPMPQSVKDLVPQFNFLYPEKRITEDDVVELIQPVYVRTTKGELGIPSVEHVVKKLPMPQLQREIYDTLKSEIKRELNPHIDDTSKVAIRHIAKSVIKIMQFVSNPALLATDINYAFNERMGQLLLTTDGPKVAYVCQRARQLVAENKKVIIWSNFVRNVELIATRLSDLGADFIHGGVDAGDEEDSDTREGKIKRFHDDPHCMILVANPAACSEGISLHKVCQNAIYLDRSFNAAHYLQSEDRIHRLGLSKDARPYVEIIECENSIDQVIRERLNFKVEQMALSLNDQSLNVEANPADYDDEFEYDGLSTDDAKAIIKYFFGGEKR